MEEKRKELLYDLLVGIFILSSIIVFFALKNHKSIPFKVETNSKLDTLQSILATSEYFKDSTYEYDTNNDKLTVDKTYEIYIKGNLYTMNIKNDTNEDGYCQIVDAIYMNLGGKKGESMKTCEMVLNGLIKTKGIDVEFFDSYKVLSINNVEKLTLYKVANTHIDKDIISVDEINYNITVANYLFTSIFTKSDNKKYSICGNIFNDNRNFENFTFTIYNPNKEIIDTKQYIYKNDTRRSLPFCVEFAIDKVPVNYFSVELTQEE